MPTVLVADDHADTRELLIALLNRAGFATLAAEDGQEAIDVTHESHPDLILMDLQMPVVDGWEAARQIKAQPESKNTPIIALTADARGDDRLQAAQAGCDAFHPKPIDRDALARQIETLLSGAAQFSASEPTAR